MSFQDIKGQVKAIDILKGYIAESRLAGAYLFCGAEGIGKKLAAKEVAKALNCSSSDFLLCEGCPSCLKIEKNQHPDLHIISAEESEIKIESIRQLQREIAFKPYEGKKKIFIIDDAHKMNKESQGALLKILEEPPKDSVIVLITDRPKLLFKTIISRCKTVKFLPLLRQELQEVLKKEHGLDKTQAHFLAYFSEGRLGRALRLKDTDIMREKNSLIDRFCIRAKPNIDDLAAMDKPEIRDCLNILASWYRDAYLLKAGLDHSEVINFDRKNELLSLVENSDFAELDEALNAITGSVLYLEKNINVKLMLHNLGAQLWRG